MRIGRPLMRPEPDTSRPRRTPRASTRSSRTSCSIFSPASARPCFRVVDRSGAVLPPVADRAGVVVSGEGGPWEREVASVARRLTPAEPQTIGYLALDAAGDGSAPVAGRGLYELVVTKIVDRFTRRDHGALAIGFPVEEFGETGASAEREVRSGIWHAGRIYSHSIPDDARPALAAAVATSAARRDGGDSFSFDVGGAAHLVFQHALYADSGFPPSYQVVLYSLAELRGQQRTLGWRILGFGALGLVLALALTLVLAQRLSVPIRELASATEKIGAGNLDAKVPVRSSDETGRLAAAFNEMVDGLALKERYRSVLDIVADKSVAQRLVDGELALGGELRDVTVLFCDIRGFTALTEEMAPTETITLLNEHMTALTGVVHAHGGVVDKFIGDGLMALFGAPQASDDHAGRAVAAAAAMLAARRRLNVASGRELGIGIGVASGPVVAGCVGAEDRLNYTVVGAQVNLAARLCAQAAAMEILIDEATHRSLAAGIAVESIPALVLKGFSVPVAAYKVTWVPALATAS
jgi:class 3 adenylate cyclase